MPKCRTYLSIKLCGSILLIVAGCGESANTPVEVVEVPAKESTDTPDLSAAIAKRMEGDSKQAVQLLRKLNEEFPNSSEILTQLGRSLLIYKIFRWLSSGLSKHFLPEPTTNCTVNLPKPIFVLETKKMHKSIFLNF